MRSLKIGQRGSLLLLQLELLLFRLPCLSPLELSGLLLLELLLLLQKQLLLLVLLLRLKMSGGCSVDIIDARHAVILWFTPACQIWKDGEVGLVRKAPAIPDLLWSLRLHCSRPILFSFRRNRLVLLIHRLTTQPSGGSSQGRPSVVNQ